TLLYQIWTLPAFLGNETIGGIPATGIGTIGMILNLLTMVIVSQFTPKPTPLMQKVIEDVRYPGRSEVLVAHAEGRLAEEELHGEGPHHLSFLPQPRRPTVRKRSVGRWSVSGSHQRAPHD